MERNELCWCGSSKKWKKCHFPQGPVKSPSLIQEEYRKRYGIFLKTFQEIEGIRKACVLASEILEELCKAAKVGITTNTLDALCNRLHREAGATPAPLNYGEPPYPKSICTSINDVICHGIPDDVPLKEGDLLNIDVSTILGGYFGDCSKMVAVGKISPEKKKVMNVSYECLMRAIAACEPGAPLCIIGQTIEDYATSQGCSVVNQFVGHGIGIQFHEPPQIYHHYNQMQILFAPGMTFTIEPMINAGVREGLLDPTDGWTVRTKDGKASAQWEHTILITETGSELLTSWTH